jgi:sporulation protein YlmC with PRC-barrel domain
LELIMDTMNTGLERLVDTPLRLAEGAPDLRGVDVHDADGEKVGTVQSLFVDRAERRVRFLEVAGGGIMGIGDREILVPVEAVSNYDDKSVRLARATGRFDEAPTYDPALVDDRAYWEGVYGWYGYSPTWAPGVGPVTPIARPWR